MLADQINTIYRSSSVSPHHPDRVQTAENEPADHVEKTLGQEWYLLMEPFNLGKLMSAQLEPCPKCGSKVAFQFLRPPEAEESEGFVMCLHCGRSPTYTGMIGEIVDEWNRGAAGC
jgi:DNA-directed RNA polymerase subunit M/transcription elongation factor TFIIS